MKLNEKLIYAPGFADLHVHSSRSDALSCWSPEEVLHMAQHHGINHVAISDHNMLNENWEKQSEHFGIDVISSTEMSSAYTAGGRLVEPHIVGFRLNPKADAIRKIAEKHQQSREGYLRAMLDGLRADPEPIDISYEELIARNPQSKHIGRVAIGEVIIERGFAKDMDEVYHRRLGRESGAPSFVESTEYLKYEPLETVIRAIMASGGLPILAHLPYYNLTEKQELELLALVKEVAGNQACMETEYTGYDRKTVERLKHLAKYFGMAESAGSDFHGYEGHELKRGSFEIYSKLQQKWEKYHG